MLPNCNSNVAFDAKNEGNFELSANENPHAIEIGEFVKVLRLSY